MSRLVHEITSKVLRMLLGSGYSMALFGILSDVTSCIRFVGHHLVFPFLVTSGHIRVGYIGKPMFETFGLKLLNVSKNLQLAASFQFSNLHFSNFVITVFTFQLSYLCF